MARKREKTFHLEEATIVDLHAAYRSGNLNCLSLVKAYFDRIEAYDKKGPAINAILNLNPKAHETARSFDRILARRGLVGPLHGIPVVLKDNYETAEMATTAGSKALEKLIPSTDAFVVKRLRDAGALILAKTNTHLGRPWSEGLLIQLAYAFEQATKFRQPPRCVPPRAGALNGTGKT